MPDLTGLKMRATGTYRPLFRALGASTINIKSSEIFTALQRGTVVGFGWPDIAVVSLSGCTRSSSTGSRPTTTRPTRYVTVNPKVWDSLTKEQKAFLEKQALVYETESVKWLEVRRAKEEKEMLAAGVKDIALKGDAAARYLDIAHQVIWKELKERSEYHDKLKPLMYVPGKPNRQVDIGRALRQ